MKLSTPWKSRSLFEQVLVCAVIILTIVGIPMAAAWLGFKAAAGVALANTFATPTNVMRKVARRLVNNTVFASNGANRSYDDQYRLHGVKQGDTVTARLPQRYELTIGAVMNPTPLTDQTVNIRITDQSNVGFEYDSWAATLEVDDYMERYGAAAVDLLINNVDYTGLARMYKQVSNCKGTPGVVPGSTGTLPQAANQPYLDAVTELFDGAAPDPYNAFLSANMHAYLANANVTVFNPTQFIAAMFRKGQFGNDALGVAKWFKTQNIATHTVGALGGTPLVNGAGQSGASIILDGAGATAIPGYFLEGDNISIGGVYSINPLTHASTGRLKNFTVTADTASIVTTGAITSPITPSLIASGPFANCTNTPADNSVIKAFGSATAYAGVATPQGIIGHKDAFALVMADLVLPKGLWVSERISNAKLGISIRMLKDHDIINDISPARLDTAHGWKAIRQELACRVCS